MLLAEGYLYRDIKKLINDRTKSMPEIKDAIDSTDWFKALQTHYGWSDSLLDMKLFNQKRES
jgi:hypothetical protein